MNALIVVKVRHQLRFGLCHFGRKRAVCNS